MNVKNEEIESTYSVRVYRFKDTGTVSREFWYSSSGTQEAPDDRPAIVHYDKLGRATEMHWRKQGELHRDNGPAWIELDWSNPEAPVIQLEIWAKNGRYHRTNGSAIIHRDPLTGEITKEESYMDDKRVRKSVTHKKPHRSVDPEPSV